MSMFRRRTLLASASEQCGGHHITGLRVLAWEASFLAEHNGCTILHGMVCFAEDMDGTHCPRARQALSDIHTLREHFLSNLECHLNRAILA